MNDARTTSRLVCAWLLALCAGMARADPQVGWWWNPDESGRGFFIESQNGTFYLATYLYADDGRARWLVSGGPNADPNHWAGRLQEFRGGQTLFGSYALPSGPADVGAIAVDFADATHGTITWPGGVVAIERDLFGTPPAMYQPESGWWWNPAESGSGYSIEVQGGNLFFVGFMYDAASNPVWYFSAGPMSTPTTYSGALQQFANGQTLTGAYRAPGAPTTLGTLQVAFIAPDAATLTFTGTAAAQGQLAPHDGQSREVPIQREFKPGPHRYERPNSYTGSFTHTFELKQNFLPPLESISATAVATGSGVTWKSSGTPATPTGMLGAVTQYAPSGGTVSVTVNYASKSPIERCTGYGSRSFDFVDSGSSLLISDLAQYSLVISVDEGNLQVPVQLTCVDANGHVTIRNITAAYAVRILPPLRFAQDDVVSGAVGPAPGGFGITRTGSWSLTPNPNGF